MVEAVKSVKEYFETLPQRFQAEAAKSIQAVFQFELADPDGGTTWQPETAVVLAGTSSCEGPSYHGCCDVLNFFESKGLADHQVAGGPAVAVAELFLGRPSQQLFQ